MSKFRSGYRNRHSLLFLSTGIAVILTSGVANGQSAMPPQAAANPPARSQAGDTGSLGEIVVTAEKRSSTIQRTPLSITALTGAELEHRGITTVDSALHDIPGISMKSAGPGQTEIEMRGMSSSAGASPTVGFYLDDTPLSPAAFTGGGKVVVDPDLYDLARVEALRGPQGTLYGSGSMGGTVRLITNAPDPQRLYGSAAVDASGTVGGNVPNGALSGMINIPIVKDKIALRVVATDKYNSGWIDRIVEDPFPLPTTTGCTTSVFYGCARGDVANGNVVADHKDVNWEHLQGARAQLLIKPTENFTDTTSVFYQTIRQGGANTYDTPPGSSGVEAHYQPADIREPFYDRFLLIANTAAYDFGFANLSASTSYWSRKQNQTQDFSETLQNVFFLPAYDTGTDQGLTEIDSSHQFSEEVRLTSESSGRFKWIAGGFFSHMGSFYYADSQSADYCSLSVGGCAANPSGVIFLAHSPYSVTQVAAFGEASYKILPTVTVTVGLRYFNFDLRQISYEAGLFSASGNQQPAIANVHSSSSGVTPKFNVSYQPSGNTTIYANAAEGFREGGVNNPLPTSGAYDCTASLQAIGYQNGSPLQYKPDTIWSYELGEKARLANGKLSVNGDVYYIKWRGVQQFIAPACGFPFTDNAGNAASYGPELEITYRVTDHLTLEGSSTYTHATLTSVSVNSAFYRGEPIQNIPKYTENAAIIYSRKIWDNTTLRARVSNSLVGPTHDLSYYHVVLPTYDIINARLEFEQDKISYALYVNNLTNTRAQLSANTTEMTDPSPAFTRIATNQPLTAGVTINLKF